MAKASRLARRVAIRYASFSVVATLPAIVGQETDFFVSIFIFDHLDQICYLYHTLISMPIHREENTDFELPELSLGIATSAR